MPSPPPGDVVTLMREGQESVDLSVDQVTPTRVARIFSVSIYRAIMAPVLEARKASNCRTCCTLHSEFSILGGLSTHHLAQSGHHMAQRIRRRESSILSRLYERNIFDFNVDVGVVITRLVVECRLNDGSRASSSRILSLRSPSTPPIFTKKGSGSSIANVKITQAIMKKGANNRPEFKRLHQTFVEVMDSTANIYLSNAVREKWGSEYMLVTADGLTIDESSGTRGEE